MAQVSQSFTVAALGASKANVVASGTLPASPVADSCVVMFQNVDSHRQVEINECITQLRDFMIENDFSGETTAASLSMQIDGGKGSIVAGVSGTDGSVSLLYSNEGGEYLGTEQLTAMVEYCRMYMRDNYLKLL